MTYENVIKGNIVLDSETIRGYIGINDGKIAEVSESELKGENILDYENQLIFPGAIDVHVHCFSNPNEGIEKTTELSARGGVTTFIDMPYDLPNPVNNIEILEEKIEDLKKNALVDMALWGTIKKYDGTDEIDKLLKGGVTSFKLSTFETDEYRFPKVPNDEIIKAMEILADKDTVIAFHSEDDEIVKSMVQEYQDEGKIYNLAHTESRPPYTETAAVLTLLEFAYWTKAKIHIVHVSHPRTIDLIKIFKDMGVDVSVETCYTYLLLDKNDLDKYGPAAKMNPPLKDSADVERMWEHLREGNIDFISSDHIVWEKTDKDKGKDNIFKSPSGLPGLEFTVPLLFDAFINQRGLSNSHFAKMMSSNAAKRFSLKNKGDIKTGYDADFVIIDPEKEWQMKQENFKTDVDLLPFKERTFKGAVTSTIVRGEKVFENGEVLAEPGFGRFIEGRYYQGQSRR